MKFKFCFYSILLSLLFVAASERPVHIFMAGDSTMANKVLYKSTPDPVTGEMIPDVWPERGWGQMLPDFFSSNVVIDNMAKNGRSTKSFKSDWEKLIAKVQPGDYVIIQFGHNDEPQTKKNSTTPDEYKKNLEGFVDDVKAKKGNPILCTPVVRRKFDKEGKFEDSHGEYCNIVRKIASDKKIPLIDLYEKTKTWIVNAGPDKTIKYFMHVAPGVNRNFPKGNVDDTHFVSAGATAVAGMFVDELKSQKISGLTKLLKENESQYVSKVWVSDLGNGKYKNPVLYADYSDPDVCRAGDDYYMTASSFSSIPGLPILHSKDLVNWTIINHAIPRLIPEEEFIKPQHGNGVWAPAIRYHNGEFYIYYGDPDYGIYMTKTKDPRGEWSPLTLVKAGKGLIDSCPFWDEDGQAYLAHAYAGSRAGIKSVLAISRMTPDGKKVIGDSKIIYNGHDIDETIEGPKVYKRNGYYYIFAPAGGVATGWQTILRSKDIFGPYERKVVLAQGNTKINGPHQGAWVDTKTGEDWFYHFQDTYAYGRVVHLQPMIWKEDWPVIGEDKDGDGCGNPVLEYKKPNVGKTWPIATPAESDEFSSDKLGLQWQWHGNPMDWWYYANAPEGCLSLFSVPISDNYKSLWDVTNLLLQKTPATEFSASMKLTFKPNSRIKGERTGLIMMGMDYALLSFENTEDGFVLSQNECPKADRGGVEKVNESVKLSDGTVYLKVTVKSNSTCKFSYSTDGKKYTDLGKQFSMKEGKWIGAKIGSFCTRPVKNNDGGRVDIDWFRVEK